MTQRGPAHFDVIRQVNRAKVRKALQSMESGTKADIAAATGLSFPTVGSLLSSLVKSGEVIHLSQDESTGGRPAERFAINLYHTLAAVIYLEGNTLAYALSDSLGGILLTGTKKVENRTYIESITDVLQKLIQQYETIRVISIGLPGGIEDGSIFFIPGYPELEHFDIRDHLSRTFGLPVLVENDLNAIVLGQYHIQFESSVQSLIHIFNGSNGPGAGIILGGQLVKGNSGFVGELGFMPIYSLQTLHDVLSSDPDRGKMVDALARTVVSVSCLLNPHYIAISGIGIDAAVVSMVANRCQDYFPGKHVPHCLFVKDTQAYYFAGLIHTALSRIYDVPYIQ